MAKPGLEFTYLNQLEYDISLLHIVYYFSVKLWKIDNSQFATSLVSTK